ncbi:MAG: hypothetical protein ABF278_08565 [Wenyingzhuangia sp.]|uniref:GREB1-related protein n=1 Tax=Wenyingzhuangia sp. TaxID=1964193 RepID=UPI00321A40D2
MNKYPIYIVSKGRWENPVTAKRFIKDGLDFKVLVEPQEYDNYCNSLGEKYILKLPFSNLGVGSYPARNYGWEHSIQNGHKRHWMFDDNIYKFRRVVKGKKIPCNAGIAIKVAEDFTDRYLNIGISGFNYSTFVVRGSSDDKPFRLNCHVYSAMLMSNEMPFRWRLKYNEDVDLCLQALHNKLCTVLFSAFTVDKVSTVAKMKGGNQTELYKDNAFEKKVLKSKSLQEVWPQYAETKMRYGRPHHWVSWKKYFKHPLIRSPFFDWESLKKVNEYGMKKVKMKK